MRDELELGSARAAGWLSIQQAAEASGVSAKMIRHYESIGLLGKARRTAAGYRIYGEVEVRTLQFVRRARDLGFSTREIGALLALWSDRRRRSADVHRLAQQHVARLDGQISEMQAIRGALMHLLAHCHGDDRPECPVLDDLAALPAPARQRATTRAAPALKRPASAGSGVRRS
jgi:MerR family transcriptional regulator, copper efflux regulator